MTTVPRLGDCLQRILYQAACDPSHQPTLLRLLRACGSDFVIVETDGQLRVLSSESIHVPGLDWAVLSKHTGMKVFEQLVQPSVPRIAISPGWKRLAMKVGSGG